MTAVPPPHPNIVSILGRLPASSTRLVGLDALRVLAAVAVVYIHVPETANLVSWASWGRFAVPAFTTMSIVLLLMNLRRRPPADRGPYVRKRFVRLYALFLVWNFVYLAARLLKKVFVDNAGDHLRLGPGTILFSGFAEHLWYLSSIAWVSLLMAGCIWIFLSLGARQSLVFSLAVAGAGILLCTRVLRVRVDLDAWPSSYFAEFSISNLAAGCFALLVGWLWINPLAQKPALGLCLASFATGFVALWLGVAPDAHFLWSTLSGPFFVLAALTFPVKTVPPALHAAAVCALPVYCVHILLVEGIQAFAHKFRLGASPLLDAVVLVVTLAGSFLFGLLLQRLRPNHWFVALHR